MAKLEIEILTPQKVIYRDEVDMVEAKGTLGEFGVLPGHIQFLATLEEGEIRCIKEGKTTFISGGRGFCEVLGDRIIFLLEAASLIDK